MLRSLMRTSHFLNKSLNQLLRTNVQNFSFNHYSPSRILAINNYEYLIQKNFYSVKKSKGIFILN